MWKHNQLWGELCFKSIMRWRENVPGPGRWVQTAWCCGQDLFLVNHLKVYFPMSALLVEGGGFPEGRRWIKKCQCCRRSGQAQPPTHWPVQRGGLTPSVSNLTHWNPDPIPVLGLPSPFDYILSKPAHGNCPSTVNSSVPSQNNINPHTESLIASVLSHNILSPAFNKQIQGMLKAENTVWTKQASEPDVDLIQTSELSDRSLK